MRPDDTPIYVGELNRTPLGDLRLAASDLGLVAVEWRGRDRPVAPAKPGLDRYLTRLARPVQVNARALAPFAKELGEYLAGRRRHFTFQIDWASMRPFQREVLKLVYAIPCGETRTYRDIAMQLERPRAARAVGRANATNPMPLVIPCHRLIGTDGKLHGYGGGDGLATKAWLLKLEGAVIA
jgi:methylated-DNA-[protein]-cysteine S-methyltransferase